MYIWEVRVSGTVPQGVALHRCQILEIYACHVNWCIVNKELWHSKLFENIYFDWSKWSKPFILTILAVLIFFPLISSLLILSSCIFRGNSLHLRKHKISGQECKLLASQPSARKSTIYYAYLTDLRQFLVNYWSAGQPVDQTHCRLTGLE